ncbi:MAG: HAD-IC family P-type ATPase [Trichodesmium sp. St16_bin4-tuft]|nr:HAD-IC family P-type ATPase [Trichodesmium sp. MAG_R01]MDE5097140.1 HAD-IC family P-type ATPase [Trichodesmium sp. St16_bin4-tuft]MDE5104950.1 HAD-IC family P-type ATPase [Trichodesmium sp. St19_bin2]
MNDRQNIQDTSIIHGLTKDQVINLRAVGRGNNVKLDTSRSYRQILKENLFTFINTVFLSISLVLISLSRYGDAFLVIIVILGGVIVSVCQEIWAKQKLDQIALLARPLATVIRETKQQNIDPSEIVVGDILVVHSGDQIVVDGQVVGKGQIEVDESLLTGESDLVPKQAGQPVYSGSFCVSGTTYYEAQKVGTESFAYQLTVSARAFRQIYTPLQQEINLVIRVFLLLSCFLWILVSINWYFGFYKFVDTVQYAAVIAGLVPSGLYLAITLAYTLGAVKMVGQEVLIQQANAVESLSNVDILCLDKTGTLTTNYISLQAIYPIGIDEIKLENILGEYAASTTSKNKTIEALERVFPRPKRSLIFEIPFTSARRWSGMSFATEEQNSPSGTYILGAPEILAEVTPLSTKFTQQIQKLAQKGFRVLLFAYNPNISSLDQDLEKLQLPTELFPLGIISFQDELRPEARETIEGFSKVGIKIKVISGDNPQTVATLALQAGLGSNIQVISGSELAKLDEDQFIQAAKSKTIFGCVTPRQKAKLIHSFKKQGHYVAMIGDGVNDVLSLKEANLAIAMEGGSKATRSVADIILLNNSFASLPHTFLEGQRIRNSIQDVLKLFMIRVFCVSILIFSTGFIGGFIGGTFPLLNKHSAVVTLISVGFPTFCIPIWAKPGILPRRSMIRSLLHFTLPATFSLTLVALLVYLTYLAIPFSGNELVIDLDQVNEFLSVPRSALVTIMILCGLLLVPFLKPPTKAWVGGETYSGDWRYTFVALALLGVYIVILAVPPLRQFFELSLLSTHDYLVIIWVALVWCLLLRYVWRTKLLDKFLGVDLS